MPRTPRHCPAGEIFHVLNRAVARLQIFEKPEDYDAFMRVVEETVAIVPLPIYSMIAMPNHWHFVVQPTDDRQVSEFSTVQPTPATPDFDRLQRSNKHCSELFGAADSFKRLFSGTATG